MPEKRKMIYSERLRGRNRQCSECGAMMASTGKMFYNDVMSEWFIEYFCPKDQELFNIFAPEIRELAESVAAEKAYD